MGSEWAIKEKERQRSCLFRIRYYHQTRRVSKDNLIAIDHGMVFSNKAYLRKKLGAKKFLNVSGFWVPCELEDFYNEVKVSLKKD